MSFYTKLYTGLISFLKMIALFGAVLGEGQPGPVNADFTVLLFGVLA